LPVVLDETDIAIIKSLLTDGRKSFRQISRETKITTPTVKARFERLVNVGFIKGVLPVFDYDRIDDGGENLIQIQNIKQGIKKEKEGNILKNSTKDCHKMELDKTPKKLTSGLAINLECDFCEGPIFNKPKVLKFADFERFFCCSSCKSGYGEKYKGRIESIKKRYEGKSELEI
jgi:DNA-binding Lrp family transcriptional regulator